MRKFGIVLLIALCVLVSKNISYAAEPVPFDEFVKITDQVFDIMDEIETTFVTEGSTQMEAKLAFKKFDTAMKKYDRYGTPMADSTQGEVAWAIIYAKKNYDLALMQGTHGKFHYEAQRSTQEARDTFLKYKSDKTKKQRKKSK